MTTKYKVWSWIGSWMGRGGNSHQGHHWDHWQNMNMNCILDNRIIVLLNFCIWKLYCGYVRQCSCSYEKHVEVIRNERSWYLHLILKRFCKIITTATITAFIIETARANLTKCEELVNQGVKRFRVFIVVLLTFV